MTYKNCPFCGASDESLSCDGHFVQCDVCHSTGPPRFPIPDRDECITAWNQRSEPDDIPDWLTQKIRTEIKYHEESFYGTEYREVANIYVSALYMVLSFKSGVKP